MDEKVYADSWGKSAKYFSQNNDYKWMCEPIKEYKKVLEIGCGTGESTLDLLKQGHKVIAIEKNEYCLNKAKQLIEKHGYEYGNYGADQSKFSVEFIHGSIIDNEFSKFLQNIAVDIVICWNVGTNGDKNSLKEYYCKLIKAGYSHDEIIDNIFAIYTDHIHKTSFKNAVSLQVPIHIIDRITEDIEKAKVLREYYCDLKEEFQYKKIILSNTKTKYCSGGIPLKIDGTDTKKEVVDIILVSALFLNE